MILVLASRFDQAAAELVARWSEYGARLFTCRDLSSPGWSYSPGRESESVALVGGQAIPASEIGGIVVRLAGVSEREVPHIAEQDRAFVASEMNAFLIAWLSALHCPVLNRPCASGLLAPGWRDEQWMHAAAMLGIPVRPAWRLVSLHTRASPPQQSVMIALTVVGERVIGSDDMALAAQAKRLAREANVDLLTLRFDNAAGEPRFYSAEPLADLDAHDAADAVLEYMMERSPRARVA
ncbi:MAG: hypothetical protein ACM3JD_18150 [Rudaea sp.]